MPVTHSDIQLYATGVELGDELTGAGAGTVFVKKNNNIHFPKDELTRLLASFRVCTRMLRYQHCRTRLC